MKITEVTSKGLQKEYNVVVDAAALSETMDSRLKAMGSKAKIPGFRPGHIPMPVLRQRYGKAVMGEVIELSVKNASQKVVKDNNLRPAMQPQIEIKDYKEGGDLSFNLKVEIFPQVPEIAYDKIKLERPRYEATDKDVNDSLARFTERNKKLEKRDAKAKAKNGDVVEIDFKGFVDGEAFAGGEAKNFKLELGSSQFIEGFEDQLVGAKEGDEIKVKVTFPKDYHKKDLAGKKAEFEVKVHGVFEQQVPPVDDEFAKSLGLADLTALKTSVREQLQKEYDALTRNKLKKALFDYMEKEYDFEIPQGMVEMEFNTIWQQLQEAKKQGDTSLDKPEDELRKEYRKIAERRVRLGILLADVGNRNKIQVTQDEMTQAVMNQARMFPGQEKKVFEFYRANPAHVEDLRGPILEEKTVDYILGKVKTTDKKVTLSELTQEDESSQGGSDKKSSSKKKKA